MHLFVGMSSETTSPILRVLIDEHDPLLPVWFGIPFLAYVGHKDPQCCARQPAHALMHLYNKNSEGVINITMETS